MKLFTIKNGQIFGYDESQQNLYEQRIKSEGHAPISEDESTSISNPNIPVDVILASVKDALRQMRDKFLGRVADIGTAAFIAGNADLANEVFAEPGGVRRKLLDITDDADLNAATTFEDMERAVLAYYAAIVANVSLELRGAFKELEK